MKQAAQQSPTAATGGMKYQQQRSPSSYPSSPVHNQQQQPDHHHQNQNQQQQQPYRDIHSYYFMDDNLRHTLVNKSLLLLQTSDALPAQVHVYHSLYALESLLPHKKPRRVPSAQLRQHQVYKAISAQDGNAYVLRRIVAPPTLVINKYLDEWKQYRLVDQQQQHSNIVPLRDVFASSEFYQQQDQQQQQEQVVEDLFLVYDYYAGAETVESHYFIEVVRSPSEPVLWSFIAQLVNAIHTLHAANISCAWQLTPSKILMFRGKNRILINGIGNIPVLITNSNNSNNSNDNNSNIDKVADLRELGKLLLSLASSNNNINNSNGDELKVLIDQISHKYSVELVQVIQYLLFDNQLEDISQVSSRIAHRLCEELSHTHMYSDMIENELAKELENGRLLRLLLKMNYIWEHLPNSNNNNSNNSGKNDSTSNNNSNSISNHRVLKILRDTMFGQNVFDVAHMIDLMNKIDCGLNQKIILAQDEDLLIASYKELKQTLQSEFNNYQQEQQQQQQHQHHHHHQSQSQQHH